MGRENRTNDPYEPPQDAELEDTLRHLARWIRLRIRTHIPAAIVAYNPATQKAVVEVQQQQVVKVTDPARVPANAAGPVVGTPPNAEVALQPFVLPEIPVVFPRTNLGYITFPLATGDTGELHVSDRALQAWLQLGAATDPQAAFTHALQDSVFHPGLHADTNPITPPTDLTGTVVEGPLVKLGRNAISPAVKFTQLAAAIDALLAAGTAAGAGAPGTTALAAFTAATGAWNAAKSAVPSIKVLVE